MRSASSCPGSVLRKLALAAGMATAAVGLTATSASALNHDSYSTLRNANTHQYCLDTNFGDPAEGARAILFTCLSFFSTNQRFILVRTSPGAGVWYDEIVSQRTGKCLWWTGTGAQVVQRSCYDFALAQSWYQRGAGEVVNAYSGECLEGNNVAGGAVVTRPCNGTINQRWFT
jgi:hypothetical protein